MKKQGPFSAKSLTGIPDPQPQTDAPVQYAGNIVKKNYWFKIGLSPEEIAALKQVRARLYNDPEKTKLASVLRAVFIGAMAHYEVIEPLLFADTGYAHKEGFGWTSLYQEELIKREFNLKPGPDGRWV